MLHIYDILIYNMYIIYISIYTHTYIHKWVPIYIHTHTHEREYLYSSTIYTNVYRLSIPRIFVSYSNVNLQSNLLSDTL